LKLPTEKDRLDATHLCLLDFGQPQKQGKRWLAFLGNHREAIAAMDFFTVPNDNVRVILLLCHQS
jgi:hypothetical protein